MAQKSRAINQLKWKPHTLTMWPAFCNLLLLAHVFERQPEVDDSLTVSDYGAFFTISYSNQRAMPD